MVEEIKWTLAYIIIMIIAVVGSLIVVKFGNEISKSTLEWILAMSIPLAIVLIGAFIKWVGNVKKIEMEKIFIEVNKKANECDSLARVSRIMESIEDHKETNAAQIDAIHEFFTSIDNRLINMEKTNSELLKVLLNFKRK